MLTVEYWTEITLRSTETFRLSLVVPVLLFAIVPTSLFIIKFVIKNAARRTQFQRFSKQIAAFSTALLVFDFLREQSLRIFRMRVFYLVFVLVFLIIITCNIWAFLRKVPSRAQEQSKFEEKNKYIPKSNK